MNKNTITEHPDSGFPAHLCDVAPKSDGVETPVVILEEPATTDPKALKDGSEA